MSKIKIIEIQKQFSGKIIRDLIQYHIKKHNIRQVRDGLFKTIELLNPQEKKVTELLINKYNYLAYDKNFWNLDCREVFHKIVSEASMYLKEFNDETLFNIFQIIILNFVLTAHEQKKFRRFIGIKKGIFG